MFKISKNLRKDLSVFLKKQKNINSFVIVTDDNIKKLYAEDLYKKLKQNFNIHLISFKPGEKSKNNQTKIKIENEMFKKKLGRDTMIIAMGGGVVGDLAGFVASTYMRGIPYIQIPTTLLAIVDSSIGGKVGINTPQGKNLVGAFYDPLAIFIDHSFLKTLKKEQLNEGYFEMLKIFLTFDKKSFFSPLNKNQKLIKRAAALKLKIISADKKEYNKRMSLNFGHTIAHALETISNYKIAHGYAVAYGILVESKISELMGFLSNKNFKIIQKKLSTFGIEGKFLRKFKSEAIIAPTRLDKKGMSQYVLIREIGKIKLNKKKYIHQVPDSTVKQALKILSHGI